MRTPMIAGNWKMYKDVNEAVELVNSIKRAIFNVDNVEIIVVPPFTDLSEAGEMLIETNVKLGAQNCFWETEGAFTGEISAPMLKSVGCKYVVIGHSERRKYFGETNEMLNKKLHVVIKYGLIPIFCVGETLEEREHGKTWEVVETQIIEGMKNILDNDLNIIIAYEPVWAIGTGKTATPEQAQEVHKMIRDLLAKLYSVDFSERIQILYGGSVNPANIESLMKEPDIDGGLIGGASLKSESFVDMVKKTSWLYAKK
ncbi:triosephosphate isomerase [Candidatus Omnitrophus magneticus]|uniref:Triosephosphate isomerase n=1 Tax=Candidatus Omnitrophus magneticus TaxID=1609969 RepID=A0A0F0CST9_9BACT|nr:triosephosphate isomerase [Candidatus Omnitrophus magneticus]